MLIGGLVAVVLMVVGYIVFSKTTEEVAFNNFLNQYSYSSPIVLVKEAYGEGDKIYIWKDSNQQMAAVILSKNMLGSWKAEEQVGFLDMKSSKENNFIWVKLNESPEEKGNGLYLGFCKGESYKNIKINGKEAVEAQADGGTIWYCVSDYQGEVLVPQ